MEPLDIRQVEALLTTAYVGRSLAYHPLTDSTNRVAKELAGHGAPDGTLVIADAQSAGRGRLGRQWLSPPNTNLLMSLLFYPPLRPDQAQRMTMVCALAAADSVAQVTGLAPQLKWPNDLLLGGIKVGGILTELGLRGGELAYTVVGIGLNVNLAREQLPEELRPLATSVAQELGRPVSREALLAAFLQGVEVRYDRLKAGESPMQEWAARLATLGQWVQVSEAQGAWQAEGLAESVDEDGALWLRLADGERRRILAGDVTLRKGQLNATK